MAEKGDGPSRAELPIDCADWAAGVWSSQSEGMTHRARWRGGARGCDARLRGQSARVRVGSGLRMPGRSEGTEVGTAEASTGAPEGGDAAGSPAWASGLAACAYGGRSRPACGGSPRRDPRGQARRPRSRRVRASLRGAGRGHFTDTVPCVTPRRAHRPPGLLHPGALGPGACILVVLAYIPPPAPWDGVYSRVGDGLGNEADICCLSGQLGTKFSSRLLLFPPSAPAQKPSRGKKWRNKGQERLVKTLVLRTLARAEWSTF